MGESGQRGWGGGGEWIAPDCFAIAFSENFGPPAAIREGLLDARFTGVMLR
jgi:hypothetical protein